MKIKYIKIIKMKFIARYKKIKKKKNNYNLKSRNNKNQRFNLIY